MWKRIWTLFVARNKEFYRDKSAFVWNLLFPLLIIIGFGMIFSNGNKAEYKIGYITPKKELSSYGLTAESFLKTQHTQFVEIRSSEEGQTKLTHHKIDMLVDFDAKHYWISESSPKSYIAEKLLTAAEVSHVSFVKETVKVKEIPYVEWLFPGILGMNTMFAALFGVGYVVIRYRKNGALKRMSVTPVHPWEFLSAQILSRMFTIIVTTTVVYIGCAAIYRFECKGSYLLLFFIYALGAFCMISLGLLVACRSSSEEFANGIINLLTWPMMFFSEVWFSLEGTHPWAHKASLAFPLTHTISAARAIMNDGATISDVSMQIVILSLMSAVFLITGSLLFKWQKD
jgi:ABC-type multidrug transport system permease subunit